jgi:two-component system, NarL family, nitrate/nitrite response regulator NarL
VKRKLTPREKEIVEVLVLGYSNKEIASRFGISPQTVKNHLARLFEKFGVSSRLELAMRVVRIERDEVERR